jgi:hypothetical protein
MPDKDTLDFVQRLIQTTIEDPDMTFWEKAKFIVWIFYITTPPRPLMF